MNKFQSSIIETGYGTQPHSIPEKELAVYAGIAREVAGIAIADESVEQALNLNLFAGDTAVGGFGLSRSRGLGLLDDNKYTMQFGVQSEAYASSVLAVSRQPRALKELWCLQPAIMKAVKDLARSAILDGLEAETLAPALLDVNDADLNILLRTNWYRSATSQPPDGDKEILSAHTDRGPLTLHLYETDSGFLVGAAYPKELAQQLDDPDRKSKVTKMRQSLLPIEPSEGQAAVLLGAGWWNLPTELVPEAIRDLPACYHVGRQMAKTHGRSAFKNLAVSDKDDRVSLVAFIDPPLNILESGRYQVPPKEVARPDY